MNKLVTQTDFSYSSQAFAGDAKRMGFLFVLYEKYTADLFTGEQKKKGKKK